MQATMPAGLKFKTVLRLSIFAAVFAGQLSTDAQSKPFPEFEEEHKSTSQILEGKTWVNAESLLEAMHAHITKLNDYSFESNNHAVKDEKIKLGSAKFYFKKEQRIRLEVHSNGINNGAVIVRKENGQVRGCGGGILKFAVMNLEPDSRMLILPTGRNVLHADFCSLIEDLRAQPKKGCQVKVTSETIAGKRFSGNAKVIEVLEPGGKIAERIFVHPVNNVPLQWDFYRDGELVSITVFENFQPNPGLQDSLFEM